MSVALKQVAVQQNGVNRKEVESSLQHISDQLRLIDRQLKVKVDNEIWNRFQSQQHEINNTRTKINEMI